MKEYNSKDLKLIAKGGGGAVYRLNENGLKLKTKKLTSISMMKNW